MTSDAVGAVMQLAAAIDAVLAVELDGLSDDEVLELLRGVEVQTRRGALVGHRMTGEVDGAGWRSPMAARRRRCCWRRCCGCRPVKRGPGSASRRRWGRGGR
jgi:hypothetical protein